MRTSRSLSALLCGVGFCALPSFAHAQETKVPVLGNLPFIGKLFVNRAVTPADMAEKSLLVNVEGKNFPLGQLIDLLMEQAHASYTLDAKLAALPTGNVKLRKVPFAVALATILKMAHGRASYTLENGIYRIMPSEEADAEKQAGSIPNAANIMQESRTDIRVQLADTQPENDTSIENIHVDVNAERADLYAILKQLFAQVHANFTLDPELRKYTMSVTMRNVPLHVALGTLLKSNSKPLTYKVENGVYKIITKEETVPENPKP